MCDVCPCIYVYVLSVCVVCRLSSVYVVYMCMCVHVISSFVSLDFIGRVVIPMNVLETCNSTLCGWFDLSMSTHHASTYHEYDHDQIETLYTPQYTSQHLTRHIIIQLYHRNMCTSTRYT